MTPWRNHPYRSPVLITLAIVIMLGLVIALANAVTSIPGAEPCIEVSMREKIRERMMEGFDEGLKAHSKKMYEDPDHRRHRPAQAGDGRHAVRGLGLRPRPRRGRTVGSAHLQGRLRM